MKANELKIGSTYHSVKFNIPVTLTAEDIYELVKRADGANISHYIDEMFKPIPLTQQWLKDFGFKKAEEVRNVLSQWDEWVHDEIVGNISYNLHEKNFEYYYDYHKLSTSFKYVHQLQNLYWCLCGNELTK